MSQINGILRRLIGAGITLLAVVLELRHRARIRTAERRHARLRRRFGLDRDVPIVPWDAAVERSLHEVAAKSGGPVSTVFTSGSAATPKKIPYTAARVRSVRLAYIDMFARACLAFGLERRSLYFFSSLQSDDSLTSRLLDEPRLPPYLSTLQAPYRVHRAPALLDLAQSYGSSAVRLWVLTHANPGVLYSTNPSTLSLFLDDVASDWLRHSRLVREFAAKPEAFDHAVHRIAGRIASPGAAERLAAVSASAVALPLETFAPGATTYICWTGGQVGPFLDRLDTHLPPARYRRIPMYSMATETIETIAHFSGGAVAFLPMAAGVCYEFIEEGADDRPENLLSPGQLRAGRAYAMVVSDRYGLRRYQTGDLFECAGFVGRLPDLRFLRRRGLGHSFTGEKLTGEQLALMFERLRAECHEVRREDFLTCVPAQAAGRPAPHYIVILSSASGTRSIAEDQIAARCDRLLGEVNQEYRGKRDSGRLGAIRVVQLPLAELASRLGGAAATAWQSQFKFLPLYREAWEDRT